MQSYIDVWRDKIILRYKDGLPPGADDQAIHAPDDLLPFWPHVGPYTKFNPKLAGFLMTFSKQNLQRLRKEFGEIEIKRGYEQVTALKERMAMFKTMAARAASVKNGESKESIAYKVPPLGSYQDIGVKLLTNVKRVPLFADCGVGKSCMVLVSTQEQIRRGIIKPGKTLITGKLLTLESGWLEDAKKFTDLKINLLWAPAGGKRKDKILAALNEDADAYLINHEGLKLFEQELTAKQFDKVVVDESTVLKSFSGLKHGQGKKQSGGVLATALLNIAAKAEWRVIMSGTPAPNSVMDLWGQMYFLDPDGFVLDPSFYDFRRTYMREVKLGRTITKWVQNPDAPEKVGALIKDHVYRVKIRDHLTDLPPKTIIKRPVQMGPKQDDAYQQMKKNKAIWLSENNLVSATVKLSEIMKLRQVTGGFLIDHQEVSHPLPENPKLDMLSQLLEEEIHHSEKVVIFAQYQWEIELIEKRYKDFGIVTVYGGNSGQRNMANIRTFIDSPSCRLIVLHPQSAAHGITLTCAHYMIFYSISYSAEQDYQCQARIERASQRSAMFIFYILARDSIDETIYRALQTKTRNQGELIDQGRVDTEILNQWAATP